MAFNILTIRTADDEDGSMYPVLGDERSPIELERLDGSHILPATATALEVNHGKKDGAKVSEIKADVLITDARVAVACAKFDKGGGWTGFGTGFVVAMGINAVSKARAAHRRRGKMLVGHVRYPWLRSVGFTTKTGFLSNEEVRLLIMDNTSGQERSVMLDLAFPKTVSASEIARAIAERASRYRLTHDLELGDEERRALEGLAHAKPLTPEPKKFVFYDFPTYFKANPATAYPKAKPEPIVDLRSEPAGPTRDTDDPIDSIVLHGSVAEHANKDTACPTCAVVPTPGARYCGACGTALGDTVDSMPGE